MTSKKHIDFWVHYLYTFTWRFAQKRPKRIVRELRHLESINAVYKNVVESETTIEDSEYAATARMTIITWQIITICAYPQKSISLEAVIISNNSKLTCLSESVCFYLQILEYCNINFGDQMGNFSWKTNYIYITYDYVKQYLSCTHRLGIVRNAIKYNLTWISYIQFWDCKFNLDLNNFRHNLNKWFFVAWRWNHSWKGTSLSSSFIDWVMSLTSDR